jgi:hypothetical protein
VGRRIPDIPTSAARALSASVKSSLTYRYQYIRAGAAVFRYDNAAHHPHIATFHHHKHVGNKMLPAIEPTLKQVLDEVNELLQKGADSPSSHPKRRRQRKPRS